MNLAEIRRDIILFKDETLKIIREMGKQLFEGMKQKSNELDSKIAEIESKLSKYKETNKRMYDIILEQKIYNEKIKNLTEFKSKTETRLIAFDIKLSNFFSELVNFKSRYDKIIIDNLTIPGIIGVSCKFNTIADYIMDNINKTKLFHAEQDKIKNDVNTLKKNNENFDKSVNGAVDVSVSTSKLYADSRNNELRNFIMKKIEDLSTLLSNTQNNIELNVMKKEEVKNLVKNEIKNTKRDLMNIIEEQNKEINNNFKEGNNNKEKTNREKKINNSDVKKEIIEIKKNIKDLKVNIDRQISNTIKLIKDKENINNFNNNAYERTNSKNIKLKNDNHNSKENINSINTIANNKQDNNKTISSTNNNEAYYRTLQNNDTLHNYLTDNNKNFKEEKNINSNKNKEESFRFKINGTQRYKIKSTEKSLDLKATKETNKLKGILLNPIYLDTNKNEHNIIETESPIRKNKNFKDDITKNQKISSRNDYKYRTFSEAKYQYHKKLFKENNNTNNNEEIKINNKLNFNTKEKNIENKTKKKYVIHSINSDILKSPKNASNNNNNDINNTSSNDDQNYLKLKKEDSSDNDNNNIAIKLMKNKKKEIDDFNLDYIRQCFPTLNLYRNHFNKKMKENLEKEKFKEKIKIPKKISPAFGRTAYTEFVKPNNNINLKNYNGNANIVINNNFRDFIEETKFFYTINNNNIIKYRSFTKDKDKKKQKNEEHQKNLSV